MKEEPAKYLDEWAELWRSIDLSYSRLMKHFNVSANTYCVLSLLLFRPEGVEPAEIADAVVIKRQMVAQILNDLENRGWIVREGLKTDHRRKKILLTEAGQKFAGEVVDTSGEVGLRGVRLMSGEEQAQFLALTRRYCEFLKQEVDSLTAL